jgi:hypothetical protein
VDPIKWPHGIDAIKEYFGDPRTFMRGDNGESVDPEWERSILTSINLPAPLPLSYDPATPVRRIRCHRFIADPLRMIYHEVHDAGLWLELHDFGGCFRWRLTHAGTKLSTHAFAIAVDHDVARNQYGAQPTMSPGVVAIFEKHGAVWGGRWPTPDGMHFQFCSGY